jgi:dihydroorotate dehydrogenase electron transfer subunit
MVQRSQFVCRVGGNQKLCREHYLLKLEVPEFPATGAGQFIQISGRDLEADDVLEESLEWELPGPSKLKGRELAEPVALLRRPFSLAGRMDSEAGVTLSIIHRVVGAASEWFSRLKVGDGVGILGPLGNRFELPEVGRPAILVGGGVGIPPMLYLAQALQKHSGVALCGATTRDLLPLRVVGEAGREEPSLCIAEFAECGIPTLVSTDDGSLGFRGYVTAALESYLDRGAAKANPIVYTCGPELMMKRVAAIALERGLDCQVAVERAMACGMGTCQSCCIKVRAANRPDGRAWVYRLACTDGPIFAGSQLLW